MKKQRSLFVRNDGADSGEGSFLNPVGLDAALKIVVAEREGCVLYLFEGVYRITKTLCMGPELSNVEFRALSPNKVYFDGGKEISNWRKTTLPVSRNAEDKKSEVWAADVSKLIADYGEIKFLYVDEYCKPCCRYPAGLPGTAEKKTVSRIEYDFPDSIRSCKETDELELVLFYDWMCRRLKVESIDAKGLDFIQDMTERGIEVDFYLENLPLEFLAPGQWKLDAGTGTVYYMPEEGERLEEMNASAAYAPQLLDICGSPDNGEYVENVRFEGIEFRHTGDPRLVNSEQAECNCSAAVRLSGALNCRFESCGFSGTSGWGIEFADGCRDNTVNRCRLRNTGAGGIKANGAELPDSPLETCRNHFTSNEFSYGGRRWAGAVAVLLRHSADNLISGNEISHYRYSGISCGWVWGYGKNISKRNIISDNHIHHLGDNLLADMGGVYLLGMQPGTVISGNVIHDITAKYISWGIYLDEGCSNVLVEKNLVYNVPSECFHLHFGRDNLVCDNVFAFGGIGLCSVSRGTMDMDGCFKDGDTAFTCERNVMISSGGPFYIKYLLDNVDKEEEISCMVSNRNILLFSGNDKPAFGAEGFHYINKTFQRMHSEKQWQEAGFDLDSLSASASFLPKCLTVQEDQLELVDLNVGGDMTGAFGDHGGGDLRLVEDFINVLRGENPSLSCTNIDDSIKGHLVGFLAAKSREEHGFPQPCEVQLSDLRN